MAARYLSADFSSVFVWRPAKQSTEDQQHQDEDPSLLVPERRRSTGLDTLPHPDEVRCLAWQPRRRQDGSPSSASDNDDDDRVLLAVGQLDGGLALWRVDPAGQLRPEHQGLLWGHAGGGPLDCMDFHQDGDLLAAGVICFFALS